MVTRLDALRIVYRMSLWLRRGAKTLALRHMIMTQKKKNGTPNSTGTA